VVARLFIIHLFRYIHQLNRTQNDKLYSTKNPYLILEIPAKKKNRVQFTSGTEDRTEQRSQMMKDSGKSFPFYKLPFMIFVSYLADFSIGELLSGKKKLDECGNKLLSTLDDYYPLSPARENPTKSAARAKKQKNMHPTVVLVDIEAKSQAKNPKKSSEIESSVKTLSINQILSGRTKVDQVGNSLIADTFSDDDRNTDFEDDGDETSAQKSKNGD
jgi:hypothetical protein